MKDFYIPYSLIKIPHGVQTNKVECREGYNYVHAVELPRGAKVVTKKVIESAWVECGFVANSPSFNLFCSRLGL